MLSNVVDGAGRVVAVAWATRPVTSAWSIQWPGRDVEVIAVDGADVGVFEWLYPASGVPVCRPMVSEV